jgi:hypothetical protein
VWTLLPFVQAGCGAIPRSHLVDQLKQAVVAVVGGKITRALIGGSARATHWLRASRDVDFPANADDADRLHHILLAGNYRCVHRSENVANYCVMTKG